MLNRMWKRALPAFLVASAAVALALPASAKTVYSWVTEDGIHSFTDDTKRIPAKYKAEAERKRMRSIKGYARYTPSPERDRKAYLERMPGHLEKLRAKSATSVEPAPAVVRGAAARESVGVLLGTGRRGNQGFLVDPNASDEPLVVERLRARPARGNATRAITVVRQGDKIVAVMKTPHNNRPMVEIDERDLEY